MKKILITGGAGFIGSHIAEEFLKNVEYEIIILDNFISGKTANIEGMNVKVYNGDIRNKDDVEKVFKENDISYIFHEAAQVSVSQSIKDPVYDAQENILGLINILEAAKTYKAEKIIFASSAAVYGTPKFLPVTEEHPVEPLSFYGLTKLMGERYIRLYSEIFGLKYVILRYANVYGERQDTKGEAGVVAIFSEKAVKGETLTIDGDGGQTRDFVYVKDIARANAAALCSDVENVTINIGTMKRTSVNDLYNVINSENNGTVKVIYGPSREGDIRDSYLDNGKMRKILNVQPLYTLENGLSNYFKILYGNRG